MLIILPPSETKATGGAGAPLDLDRLAFPELTSTRNRVASAIVTLADDVEASRAALGLGTKQLHEIDRNAALWTSPTCPAIERYTGVLYDALDYGSMTPAMRAKASGRLAIGSALFGAVHATDPIPAYRLSGGSKLPGFSTLAATWKPALVPALRGVDEFIVDLRSGVYQQLGKAPSAVTATVVTEAPDGSRTVVSHFNKHYKGLIARELVRTRRTITDIDGVAGVLADAGQRVEIAAEREIVVVTD